MPSRPVLVLLVLLGLVLALAGAGVFELAPGQLRSPPPVLLAVGLVLGLGGVLGLFPPGHARRGPVFRFIVAVVATSAAALVGLLAWYSHDEQLVIGPFVFRGAAVDRFGKIVLGANAALLAAAAGWCWGHWRRSLRHR